MWDDTDGDVCEVPLYLISSVGVDENVYKNPDPDTTMKVDYLRCYPYK